MTRPSAVLSLAFAFLLAATPAGLAADVSDEIVVRHRAAATAGERADVRARADARLEERLPLTGVEVVRVEGSRTAALRELRADPDVLWAEPNRVVSITSADPFWGHQYGLHNVGQNGGLFDADADIPEAWEISRGAGITVGVVDTGVAPSHEDLAGQLVGGGDFTSGGDGTSHDGNGHGTHVAGIVAALGGNGLGISGAAPQAKVMPLRALGADGKGSSAGVAAAFDAAGTAGVPIVNASLGSNGPTLVERQAIQAHPNTLFVVAAGNSNADVDGGNPRYPCAYPEPNVLCVGSSDHNDQRSTFSNVGSTSVDIFAAGTSIASTYHDGGYVYMSGTSMATPLVAAAAAIVAAANPSWTATQIKSAILSTADPVAALAGLSTTGGRLNAGRAARAGLTEGSTPAPPPAPTGVSATTSPGAVTVAWQPIAGGTVSNYRVWRLTAEGWQHVTTTAATTATVQPLAPGSVQHFHVTAHDDAGASSPPSAAVSIAVASAPVAAPNPAPPAPGPSPQTPNDVIELEPEITDEDELDAARITRLSVTRARGKLNRLRVSVSADTRVRITAELRGSGIRSSRASRKRTSRSRVITLRAGTTSLQLQGRKRVVKLTRGTWRVTVSNGDHRKTITVRVK